MAPPISAAAAASGTFDFEAPQSPFAAYPSFDDWEVEQNLRQLQARVGRRQRTEQPERARASKPASARKHVRQFHAPHAAMPRPHRPKPIARRRTTPMDRFVSALEILAYACGGLLLAWSFVGLHAELWTLGVPIEVAGQASVLLGLMLQVERIWQNSRHARRKLEQFDSRLHELQQTATMLTATHGSAAQAFYAHMADEADPQMLLADLKGQLDLVAMSLSKRSA